MGPVRTEDRRADQHGEDDDTHRDHVLPRRHGKERHAIAVDVGLVALAVGLPVHHPPRHRPLVDAESQDEPDVQPGERDEDPGHDEDVDREEARQRPAGDDRPTEE